MNNIIPMNRMQNNVTMSSKEIAELVESRHDSVKRTIERLAERDVIIQPPMVDGIKSANGTIISEYQISKRDSYVIVAQLSPEFTARLVDRWQELEATAKPMSPAELLVNQAQLLFEQEQRLALTEQRLDTQETTLAQLEVNTRNGVPQGFISKSKGHRQYSQGLSKAVFEQALTFFNIQQQPYVHTENDRSTHTFAWKEDQIQSAINLFINDATQCSDTQCSSGFLNGKRFKFNKGNTLKLVGSN